MENVRKSLTCRVAFIDASELSESTLEGFAESIFPENVYGFVDEDAGRISTVRLT